MLVVSGARKLNSCLPYPAPVIFHFRSLFSIVIELAIAMLIGGLSYMSNVKSFSLSV